MKVTFILSRAKSQFMFFQADQEYIDLLNRNCASPWQKKTLPDLAIDFSLLLTNIVDLSHYLGSTFQYMETGDGLQYQTSVRGEFIFVAADGKKSAEFLARKLEILSMILDFLMGPTLFLSNEWNCNILTPSFKDTMSAWKMVSSLIEIWEYLYMRDPSVNFGLSKTVPHPRPFASELLSALSSVFNFTNMIIFCRKSIYETKLGKSLDNILEIGNSDRLMTTLLLHFFYPSKELVTHMKEKDTESGRAISKNFSRADSNESIASSYISVRSTSSTREAESEHTGISQKSGVIFSFDEVTIKRTNVKSKENSLQEENEEEKDGQSYSTAENEDKLGFPNELIMSVEKSLEAEIPFEFKKMPSDTITSLPSPKQKRKTSDIQGSRPRSPRTPRTLAKAKSYNQLPLATERPEKDLMNLPKPWARRSSVSLRLDSTTALNIRLPYDESVNKLGVGKEQWIPNKNSNSLRRENSDTNSIDSLMTNGGYFTPGVSPILQEDEINYMRLYPVFKKFYQRTSKINHLTVFLRKGTRGEFVPFNLLTWKLAYNSIDLALFYRTDEQTKLNQHACAMSRLISAFRDIITESFPQENKFSLSFDAISDDVQEVLDLNKRMPQFTKKMTTMWERISDYVIPDDDEDQPMMLQDFLANYFPGSSEKLPKLDTLLGTRVSRFLVLLQNQFGFYFCPEKLGFLVKDAGTFSKDLEELRSIVDSILCPVKKKGKLNESSIAPRIYIDKETLSASAFGRFCSKVPPGLVKFIFINWTNGYSIDYPSKQDQKSKLGALGSSYFPKDMLQIWEYSRVLFYSGYSAACWKFKQFWCIYTMSIRGYSMQPKEKHNRMSLKRAHKVFCDRNQSMVNCNVRRYLESILCSGPQSDAGFKTVLCLHSVFLNVVPVLHALKQHEMLLDMALNNPKLCH